MASLAIPLEFAVVERDSAGKSGSRRAKIKESDTPKWVSMWIPWNLSMDITVFARSVRRELAAVGLAARTEIEQDLRARITEALLLLEPAEQEKVLKMHSEQTALPQAHSATKPSATSNRKRQHLLAYHDDVEDDNDESYYEKPSVLRKTTYHTRSSGGDVDSAEGEDGVMDGLLRKTPVAKKRTSFSASYSSTAMGLGKGKKLCKSCRAVIASSKRSCPECCVPCVNRSVG